MNDVRYSELRFLQSLASSPSGAAHFQDQFGEASRAVGLSPNMYADMALTLVEELYVQIHDQNMQLLVARLRGELPQEFKNPGQFHAFEWNNPRDKLRNALSGHPSVQTLHLTYRGLRRIDELRDLLRRDRILEPFGILLDLRYVRRDLEDALLRAAEIPVSVLYADMDSFKPINDQFGHEAGDVVMKRYLEVVRDSVGSFGNAYRGRGDEVVGIIIGEGA